MRKALIVGIDDYPSIPLSGCVNDANKMEGVLKRHEDGSPNFQYKKLVAPRQSTTSSTMPVTRPILKKQLEELFRYECDVALFYRKPSGKAPVIACRG
jgi:hypothetical protein